MAVTTDKYWQNRHRRHDASLRSVGCRSFSEKTNNLVYRLVRERYGQILGCLHLSGTSRILDAGAGTGEFIPVFLDRAWSVTALDVSQEALQGLKKKFPSVDTVISDIEHMRFANKEFDIVHCFDVLYHIVDTDEWTASLRTLCRVSKKHVILHGRFSGRVYGITASHIRHRSYNEYAKIFHEEGFDETHAALTHIVGLKFPLYYFQNFFPEMFYSIDRLLNKFVISKRGSGAFHTIKVFSRK